MSKIIALLISLMTIGFVIGGVFFKSSMQSMHEYSGMQKSQSSTIHKTSNWFAGFYSFPSSNVFALPGAYRVAGDGFYLSQPIVHATENTVFGSMNDECVLDFGHPITSSRVIKYGDSYVLLGIAVAGQEAQVKIAVGSPWIYVKSAVEPRLRCKEAVVQSSDHGTLYQVNEHGYMFQKNNTTYRVGLLSSMNKDLYAEFFTDPWTFEQLPMIEKKVNTQSSETIIQLGNQAILTTIWPHQKDRLEYMPKIIGTYHTQIGDLDLIRTKKMAISNKRNDLPTDFVPVNKAEWKAEIMKAIEEDAKKYEVETPPEGVYFKGTWIGAMTSLIQLSHEYGLEKTSMTLQRRLKEILQSSSSQFAYDSKLKSYVAKKTEFGNEEGNDHHFHYGYYIRAAAILIDRGHELDPQVRTMITNMVQDIANPDYTNKQYPPFRHFSPYESHSWADGDAAFADGNNQESTSEALNAWYSVYLWGKVTSNTSFEQNGQWLFDNELVGAKTYWFGQDNPFPSGYEHNMASIVWGGKRDFTTWFSGELGHIYGIQVLPITPASKYLAEAAIYPNNNSAQSSLINHEWGDLYLATISYHDPQNTIPFLKKINTYDGIKLHSLLLQTIYSNN